MVHKKDIIRIINLAVKNYNLKNHRDKFTSYTCTTLKGEEVTIEVLKLTERPTFIKKNLKKKILETRDKPLVYISDDEENLFGRALMELRDEIRRLCKNKDKIDWKYTEYLKCKPWY